MSYRIDILACVAVGLLGSICAAHSRPLDEILQSGFFEICLQEDNAPFSDREASKGIFLDMGEVIAKDVGVKLTKTWLFSAEYIRKTSCDEVPTVADIPNDDPLRLTIPYFDVRTVLVMSQVRHHSIRSPIWAKVISPFSRIPTRAMISPARGGHCSSRFSRTVTL